MYTHFQKSDVSCFIMKLGGTCHESSQYYFKEYISSVIN